MASAAWFPCVESFGFITQFGEVSRGGRGEMRFAPSPSSPAVSVSTGTTDSDGGGVPNDRDRCPNTPPGVKVDANGCAIRPSLKFPTVHFAFDSARLATADMQALDSAAAELEKPLNFDVLVIGYTDSVDTAAYNQKLSEALASQRQALPGCPRRGGGSFDDVWPWRERSGRLGQNGRRARKESAHGASCPEEILRPNVSRATLRASQQFTGKGRPCGGRFACRRGSLEHA